MVSFAVSREASLKRKIHGIFCMETDWWNDFNRSSTVKPILKLLAQGVGVGVPFVHRDVGTRAEFEDYCRRWRQRAGARNPILYLAFHGDRGCIFVGDGRRSDCRVSLDELGGLLGTNLSGRMVHFGSCETLYTDRRNIQRFLKDTGAVAACGYKEAVDWLYSSVFEVLLFETLLRHPLTPAGARRAKKEIESEHRSMTRTLQFRMEVRD